VQGGQSCCFHLVATVLPFYCSSVWSVPPPARWGNSVFHAAFCSRDQLQDPPSPLLWEVDLSPHPHSQPLCFSQPLLGASCNFVWLACHPTPALSLYALPDLCWVLLALLGGWLVAPSLLSAFAALSVLVH
jgi:hypothetical protein